MGDAYLGVDPGGTGAIAVLDSSRNIIDIHDYIDVYSANVFLSQLNKDFDIQLAVLEKVHSFSKQGVSSVWSFAQNYGEHIGLLTANYISFQLIPPQQWQKGVLTDSDNKDKKKRGLAVCRRLYPNADYFKREKDHNRADAVLMALHAIKIINSFQDEYKKVSFKL